LRFVPQFDLTIADPHAAPTYVTRTHGYLVFDTLFGVDGNQHPSPQMVEGVSVEDDGKRWNLTLRPGLKFHDNELVLARDCAASIRRWGQRDHLGRTLLAVTDDISAADDRTVVLRLKRPFPLLPAALGKLPPYMPAMLPERLASTDAFTPIKEIIGSGPYRYRADEHVPGARIVYERFADYKPRESGLPEWTAGPKVAYFDRVVWTIIPDPSTAAAALQSGEQDWWEYTAPDVLPVLRRDRHIKTPVLDPNGTYMVLRLNHLQPPFDKPAVRRALLGVVEQADYVFANIGDPALGRTGVGFFCPTSPMANSAGMEALTSPRDVDRARRELVAAGYTGERVVLLAPGDGGENLRRMEVAADMMRKLGLSVDLQVSDFGTTFRRIFKKESADHGGWSGVTYGIAGTDVWDPAVNSPLRAVGAGGTPGWPNSPRLEELRDVWLATSNVAKPQQTAAEIQLQAFQDLPYIPLGLVYWPTAYRDDLTGALNGMAFFWNVRRAT
jgi:peptide/nickel transport system substrate-binding protein